MVALFNVVQGAHGGAPMLVLQNGAAPAPGGQIGVQLFWIPGVAPPVQEAEAHRYMRIVQETYAIAIAAFRTLKSVIDDMNATSDLLNLFSSVTELCEKKFPVPTARCFANVSKGFTAINTPRSLFSRAYSLLSGDALTQEPFDRHYNWLRLSSKFFFTASDFCKTIEWSHTIGALSNEWFQWIQAHKILTLACNLARLSAIATIAASILNAADNFRLIYKYSGLRDDTPEHERCFKLINASMDLLNDICRIACSILIITIPEWEAAKIVVGGISNCFSLGKFFIGEYTRRRREEETSQIEAIEIATLQLAQRELELAAAAHGDIRTSQAAIRLVEHTLHELARRRRVIHLMGTLPLAREVLTQAAAMDPHAIQPPLDPVAVLQLQGARDHLYVPMPPRG